MFLLMKIPTEGPFGYASTHITKVTSEVESNCKMEKA